MNTHAGTFSCTDRGVFGYDSGGAGIGSQPHVRACRRRGGSGVIPDQGRARPSGQWDAPRERHPRPDAGLGSTRSTGVRNQMMTFTFSAIARGRLVITPLGEGRFTTEVTRAANKWAIRA